MKEKKEPKIRMITLQGTGNSSAEVCKCEDDDNCPECRVQPITCDCDPQCSCVGVKPKKNVMKNEKERSGRTLFKIGKKK